MIEYIGYNYNGIYDSDEICSMPPVETRYISSVYDNNCHDAGLMRATPIDNRILTKYLGSYISIIMDICDYLISYLEKIFNEHGGECHLEKTRIFNEYDDEELKNVSLEIAEYLSHYIAFNYKDIEFKILLDVDYDMWEPKVIILVNEDTPADKSYKLLKDVWEKVRNQFKSENRPHVLLNYFRRGTYDSVGE
jgi:hypothetical protein